MLAGHHHDEQKRELPCQDLLGDIFEVVDGRRSEQVVVVRLPFASWREALRVDAACRPRLLVG